MTEEQCNERFEAMKAKLKESQRLLETMDEIDESDVKGRAEVLMKVLELQQEVAGGMRGMRN